MVILMFRLWPVCPRGNRYMIKILGDIYCCLSQEQTRNMCTVQHFWEWWVWKKNNSVKKNKKNGAWIENRKWNGKALNQNLYHTLINVLSQIRTANHNLNRDKSMIGHLTRKPKQSRRARAKTKPGQKPASSSSASSLVLASLASTLHKYISLSLSLSLSQKPLFKNPLPTACFLRDPPSLCNQPPGTSHLTQGTEPRLGLQTDPYKRTRAKRLKHDSCNDTGCNEQWPMHDTTQLNTWQGAIHNHMVTIKIWIDDRISRVTWVSSVRQLQIWLKNFYRWSKKWSRCEESKWGVKNTITRSILNL